jgi:hypothetical protein
MSADKRPKQSQGKVHEMVTRSLLSFAIASFAFMTCAQAQDARTAREVCATDYKKFCSTVTPGGGRIVKCLADNLERLAPDCKAAITRSPQSNKG